MNKFIRLCIVLSCLAISACGFTMRGQTAMPFASLYSNIARQSDFGIYTYRLIKANSPDMLITTDRGKADVILTQLAKTRSRSEVSLDADGKVEEYELFVSFEFTLTDKEGNILIEPTILNAHRLLPYDENQSAAKSAEMLLLYNDMEKTIADQLYRRLISDEVTTRYRAFNPSH